MCIVALHRRRRKGTFALRHCVLGKSDFNEAQAGRMADRPDKRLLHIAILDHGSLLQFVTELLPEGGLLECTGIAPHIRLQTGWSVSWPRYPQQTVRNGDRMDLFLRVGSFW